jgi:serpin B
MTYSRRQFLHLAALLAGASLAGCGAANTGEGTVTQPPDPSPDATTPAPATQAPATQAPTAQAPGALYTVARSDKPRQTAPDATPEELAQLVAGNSAFALDLYQQRRAQDGNLFFSPYSISLALTMTYVGARSATEQQMAQALRFSLPQERLHPAFNALALELAKRGEAQPNTPPELQGFQLNVANATWGQTGYQFQPEFLDTLAEQYGAEMLLRDFQAAPEEGRLAINQWVSEQTEEKIKDLLPEGTINDLTRMVLVNAIYFNAKWRAQFDPSVTRDGDFNLLDGSTVTVPMMAQTSSFAYTEGEGYQVVEMPYIVSDQSSGMSMVIILPGENQFATFEEGLSAEQLTSITGGLNFQQVQLTMPKFTLEGVSFSLKETLQALGMQDVFVEGTADLSGMDGTRDLFISDAIHQAFVRVDEEGTEAAAATAAIAQATSAMIDEPIKMTVNRPFVFLIRDIDTGAMLFLGRVLDPSG